MSPKLVGTWPTEAVLKVRPGMVHDVFRLPVTKTSFDKPFAKGEVPKDYRHM